MAGKTLTSSLIVRLIDQVSAPGTKVSGALLGINKAATGGASVSARLAAAVDSNNRALDRARAGLFDAAAGFYALKSAFGAPLNAAADFETQLEDIGQKVDLAVADLPALGDKIKQVAKDTNQATSQIASAVDALAGRGASLDVALAAADPIGKAATAYRAATNDLAAASWAAVDNLKVPADQIEQALDMMAQAGKDGAFELRDMATYFPSLGAAYQGLGQTGVNAVGDLAAALQVVRKGTGDASSAATNLQNVLQKVYAPGTVRKFEKAGVDIFAEMKKSAEAGLTPIEAIAEITNKTLKGDLSKIGNLFEDAQVQAGMRSLIQGMDEYRQIRERTLKASGVVDADFERRIRTARGIMDRWNASIQNVSIRLGTALVPVLNTVLDRIVPLIDKFGEWISLNPDLASGIATAAAGLVAFKVAVAGLRFVGLLGRGGALSLLSIGFNTIGKASIGAAVAARNAVGLQRALGAMSGMKLTGFQTITTGLRGIATAIPGVAGLAGIFTAIGTALATISAPVWGAVAVGAALVGSAGALIYKYWDRISSYMSGVGRAIAEQLAPALQLVQPMLEPFAVMGHLIGEAFSGIGSILSSAWEGIKSWLGSLFSQEILTDGAKKSFENAGHAMMTALLEGIKAGAMAVLSYVSDLGSRIGSSISNAASSGFNSVKGWFGGGEAPAGGGTDATPGVSGHRARGGNVWSGGSFLVGENEPEIFTPKTGGTITPASKAGGGSFTFGDIIIQGSSDPAETARRVRDTISDEINRLLRGAHSDMGARS